MLPTPPMGGLAPAALPTPPTTDAGSMTFSVPLTLLSQPDDQETMQQPAVGDSIDANVTLSVVSIQGDSAQVKATAINGQDLGGEDAAPSEGEPDTEGTDLRSMALNQ